MKEIFVILATQRGKSLVSPVTVAPRRSTMLQFKAVYPRIFGQHSDLDGFFTGKRYKCRLVGKGITSKKSCRIKNKYD